MTRFRGMLLVGAMVLVGTGCSSDPAVEFAPLETTQPPSTATTVMQAVAAPTTTTAVPDPVLEDWVPVGGSEYHDALNRRFSDDAGESFESLEQAGSRLTDLVKRIDDAAGSDELHLGAIDRFWTEAEEIREDRDDALLVAALMDRLAIDRDGQLADLPPLLSDHTETIAAALVARDFESRVAAYEVLDDVLMEGLNREPFANLIYDLHYSLEIDVKDEMIRGEALGSGRIGPQLDPENLPALPERILLVQWSDAFYLGDLVVLVGLDGVPIGYLDHHTLQDNAAMTIAEGAVSYGIPSGGVSDDTVEGCVESFVAADRTYLICDDTTSYRNPAWRAEIRVRYADGSTERLGGAGYAYPDSNPSDPVAGHWVSVMPSPDGAALLGQWSGECEVPSAHMIYKGNVTVGFGNDGELWPESLALGWRDDGLALATITWGACSSQPHESGVFTVSATGEIQPLYQTTTGGVVARLIRPSEPNPVPVVDQPARDAPDTRLQFDGFAYDHIEIGTGYGAQGLRYGDPMITYLCDNSNVLFGPADPDDTEALLAAAVGYAEQKGCQPQLAAPFECLGVVSDPVACRE